jgi:hypothetical protein
VLAGEAADGRRRSTRIVSLKALPVDSCVKGLFERFPPVASVKARARPPRRAGIAVAAAAPAAAARGARARLDSRACVSLLRAHRRRLLYLARMMRAHASPFPRAQATFALLKPHGVEGGPGRLGRQVAALMHEEFSTKIGWDRIVNSLAPGSGGEEGASCWGDHSRWRTLVAVDAHGELAAAATFVIPRPETSSAKILCASARARVRPSPFLLWFSGGCFG